MLNRIVLNKTDYLHKLDLALNNLQRLICYKTQQTKPYLIKIEVSLLSRNTVTIESQHFTGYHLSLSLSLYIYMCVCVCVDTTLDKNTRPP